MKITLEEAKSIQHRFSQILEFAPDLGNHGICYYLYYRLYNKKQNVVSGIVFDGFDIYEVINMLMDTTDAYIGTEVGYNDERIMFLLMYTEISAEDFRDIVNQQFKKLSTRKHYENFTRKHFENFS